MTDLPIACLLDPHAAADRRTRIAQLWADALIETEPTPAGRRARLRRTPEIERRARGLIADEAACCPFLAFELTCAGPNLLLEITGPDDARGVIEEFFEPIS